MGLGDAIPAMPLPHVKRTNGKELTGIQDRRPWKRVQLGGSDTGPTTDERRQDAEETPVPTGTKEE